jgi:hypothetical protein
MEVPFMKKLIAVVVVFTAINAEGCEYYICNEADDSLMVNVSSSNQSVIITPWSCDFDNSKIFGTTEQPHGGKGAYKREKRYDVSFNGYIPTPGEEPYILFKNDKVEFKLVFPEESYAELRSDQISEIHDDPGRLEYDRNHPSDKNRSYRREEEYTGNVRHWMVVGPYIVVYCYERYTSFRRCIAICNASDDNSWVSTIKESEYNLRLGIDLPPWPPQPPKRSCQSWLCGCCCCCDD